MYLSGCDNHVHVLLTFLEHAVSYNNYSDTRTFKVLKNGNFADEDLKWIKSLSNVSVVSQQKSTIRVQSHLEDAILEIVASINSRYCDCSNPKLSPLFSVHIQPPLKHKKYLS
jgi:hypothetical protein